MGTGQDEPLIGTDQNEPRMNTDGHGWDDAAEAGDVAGNRRGNGDGRGNRDAPSLRGDAVFISPNFTYDSGWRLLTGAASGPGRESKRGRT